MNLFPFDPAILVSPRFPLFLQIKLLAVASHLFLSFQEAQAVGKMEGVSRPSF